MRFIDRDEVARRLTYEKCIPLVRAAMIAFSQGETRQLLRSILPLSEGRLFGVMPGALGAQGAFGAKLISVFHGNFARGIQSHQGLVVLFDPESGTPVCAAHAGEITAIRTAAASAVATDVLARKDARRLALLGYGEQAATHARAISKVRELESIVVWGRSAGTRTGVCRPDAGRARCAGLRCRVGARGSGAGRYRLHTDFGVRANFAGSVGASGDACECGRLRLRGTFGGRHRFGRTLAFCCRQPGIRSAAGSGISVCESGGSRGRRSHCGRDRPGAGRRRRRTAVGR